MPGFLSKALALALAKIKVSTFVTSGPAKSGKTTNCRDRAKKRGLYCITRFFSGLVKRRAAGHFDREVCQPLAITLINNAVPMLPFVDRYSFPRLSQRNPSIEAGGISYVAVVCNPVLDLAMSCMIRGTVHLTTSFTPYRIEKALDDYPSVPAR
ncbi:MAG TPA: hypothetical protein VF598_01795 [Hymenobacter sp.]